MGAAQERQWASFSSPPSGALRSGLPVGLLTGFVSRSFRALGHIGVPDSVCSCTGGREILWNTATPVQGVHNYVSNHRYEADLFSSGPSQLHWDPPVNDSLCAILNIHLFGFGSALKKNKNLTTTASVSTGRPTSPWVESRPGRRAWSCRGELVLDL